MIKVITNEYREGDSAVKTTFITLFGICLGIRN
nr:MAG TPA: TMEM61 protein family [Crassvirales sp.]